MVNFDMLVGVLEGGRHAGSGHYRFHTKRVYLPCRPVPMKKSLTNARVKLAKLEPAALLHSSRPTVIALCAAQYF